MPELSLSMQKGRGRCSFSVLSSDGEFFVLEASLHHFSPSSTYYLSGDFNAFGTGSLNFNEGKCTFSLRWGDYSFIIRENQYSVICKGKIRLHPHGTFYHSRKRSFLDLYQGNYCIRLRTPSRYSKATLVAADRMVDMNEICSTSGYRYFEALLPSSLCGKRYHFLAGKERYPAGGAIILPALEETRPGWVPSSVFYQIFPDRFFRDGEERPYLSRWGEEHGPGRFFGGNLKGIMEKLDHISSLGASAIYLNPVFNAGTEHRYDTWDYFNVDPLLGSNEDLAALVSAAHGRGIRVILDAVFNHTGTGFEKFSGFLRGRNSWYIAHGDPPLSVYTGRYKGKGPEPEYETWEGVGAMPKLNFRNTSVRKYLLNVLSYWQQHAHVDGWRFDVGESLPLSFLKDACKSVYDNGRQGYMLGEIWHDASLWLEDGYYHGTMNYTFRQLIISLLLSEITVSEFIRRLSIFYLRIPYSASLCMYNLLGSHDVSRIASVLKTRHLVEAAYALLFALPGAPAVYYGDEFLMKGEGGDGARGTVDWNAECILCPLLSSLSKLRSRHAISHGLLSLQAQDGILKIFRGIGEENILFAINPSTEGKKLKAKGRTLLSSRASAANDKITLKSAGWIFIEL
jgi:cyclomaltodextrinase